MDDTRQEQPQSEIVSTLKCAQQSLAASRDMCDEWELDLWDTYGNAIRATEQQTQRITELEAKLKAAEEELDRIREAEAEAYALRLIERQLEENDNE